MKIKHLDKVTPQLPETLGQKTSAESTSVVLASDYSLPVTLDNTTGAGAVDAGTLRVVVATDQTAIPVQQSGGWTVTVSASALPAGAATEATLGGAAASLGDISTYTQSSDSTLGLIYTKLLDTLAVTQSGAWTVAISGTVAVTQSGVWSVSVDNLPVDGATETTLASVDTHAAAIETAVESIAAEDFATEVTLASVDTHVAAVETAVEAVQASAAAIEADVQTLVDRTVHAKVVLITHDHVTPVTTSAYTELTAATTGDIRKFHIFDSSGSALVIATGAAASEVDQFYVPPGGIDIEIDVVSGSRLSIKAVDSDTSSGRLLITALS